MPQPDLIARQIVAPVGEQSCCWLQTAVTIACQTCETERHIPGNNRDMSWLLTKFGLIYWPDESGELEWLHIWDTHEPH